MTDLEVVKKFAAEAKTLAKEASAMADAFKKATEDLEAAQKLAKEASDKAAAAPSFDEQKLQKAANTVATLYGDRATVTPESLLKVWGTNPNFVVDSLVKVASDSIAKRVQEPGMVSVKKPVVEKSASNYSVVSPDAASHRKSFDEIFGIVKK